MTDSTPLAGRYRLDRLLGQGGMGQVHVGFDMLLERKVAVKTLHETTEFDAQARARLRREALAAAGLDHPFICKVYEVGEHDGRSFIVMEFIEGRTLDAVIDEASLTPRQLLELSHEIAQALDEAHRHGIVHRDLKPSNIMRDVHGHVKVLDFGLAKQAANGDADNAATKVAPAAGDTRPGTRLGTPSYMSPEQVLGSPLDARSDVFSLGVVLHQLASGRHPFLKETPSDTMAAILRDQPTSTEGDLDIVPGFGQLVHRMLAKACAERFQAMGEVCGALDGLRDFAAHGAPLRSGSTPPQPTLQERTPFVARDGELVELQTHLDRMLMGHGGLVLLGGEPGVGKTRLVRELQRIAKQRGCAAITGQCYEQEGAPPFGPFVETLEQAVRIVPQAVRAALGDVAAEMTMMAPDLRRVFSDIPPLQDIPPEQKRRVLFNAYLTYVQRASMKSAAVALFDDLHWADDSSVQLLLHLAPHLSSMRLLVIGTYRDVDLDAKRPFAKALETLLRQRLATRINVKRFSASAVEQLLTTMSGARAPESFVRAVFDETEGNPFFVEELFQHLKEEDRLFEPGGMWKTDLHVEDIDVPEGVRLVVSRRVERLGEEAHKVLTAAAVIGRSFPLDLLQSVASLPEDTLLDAIDEAERAQLLQAERGREARYSFVHELIRSTLLAGLSLPRRQRLHARVADAIEARRSNANYHHIPMLAHHLYQAGAAVDQERAVAAITRAMVKARTAGAFENAIAAAEQLLSFELAVDGETLAIVEETQVDSLIALGRIDQALAVSEQYFAHSIGRRDTVCTAAAALRMARISGWLGQAARAIDKLEQALALIPPDAHRARAELLTAYGIVAAYRGQTREAMKAGSDALAAAEKAGDPVALGMALTFVSVQEGMNGRPEVSLRLSDRALVFLSGTHQPSIGHAVMQKSGMLLTTGRLAELDRFLPEGEALARRIGFPLAIWSLQHWRTLLGLMRTGDIRAYGAALEQADGNVPPLWGALNGAARAAAHFYAGDGAAAAGRLTRVLAVPVPGLGLTDHANLIAVYAWAGHGEDARRIWREISPIVTAASAHESGWQGIYAATPATTALALIGEQAACAALYPVLEPLPALGHVSPFGVIGPTSPQLALAVSADAAGLFDRARGHFEEALRLAETLPDRLLQPAVHMWFGRYLAGRGVDERAKGIAFLENAAAEFETLGMSLHRERALRWLADAAD